MSLGRDKLLKNVDKDKHTDLKRQLKGKCKTVQLMNGVCNHNQDMHRFKKSYLEHEYSLKRKRIKESLATSVLQFKKEQINKKVERVISSYAKNAALNCFQQQEGYTLTPLMEGKIHYGEMKKVENIDPVRNEVRAQSVHFEISTGWKELLEVSVSIMMNFINKRLTYLILIAGYKQMSAHRQ